MADEAPDIPIKTFHLSELNKSKKEKLSDLFFLKTQLYSVSRKHNLGLKIQTDLQ